MTEQNSGTYTFEIDPEKFYELTDEERQLVTYWRGEFFTYAYTPSYSESARKLGVNKSKIGKILNTLSKKGFNLRQESSAISLNTQLSNDTVKAVITIRDSAKKETVNKVSKPVVKEKSATQKLLDVLDAKEAKGAFIYQDLHVNRHKYGFNYKSQNRMYEMCQTLEKQGYVKIVNLYNPVSKNVNKIQAYVQKVKF